MRRIVFLILGCISGLQASNHPHPWSEDIDEARSLVRQNANPNPYEIARQVQISTKHRELISWMRKDLENYLANFENIFQAKLERIRRHQLQRENDLALRTRSLREMLKLKEDDPALLRELNNLNEIHKAHGFIAEYQNAEDFTDRFIGPRRKLIKSPLSVAEKALMNREGLKTLYVDTWAVPFFNTSTQSIAEAKEGLRQALKVFREIETTQSISVLRFTELLALFARPEFDDIRRYKLLVFPDADHIERFKLERSDARTFGELYPLESFVTINKAVDLGPVSFIFGQKLSILGLISHSMLDNTADGRIFTGPADFLEHDFAHAFFNLTPAIPGLPKEWEEVRQGFILMRDAESNPQIKRMMRLVYYHFTHESGFRILLDEKGHFNENAFKNEINMIRELIETRYHYDFILANNAYLDGYDKYLVIAYERIGNFFKENFFRIYDKHRARTNQCENPLFETLRERSENYVSAVE